MATLHQGAKWPGWKIHHPGSTPPCLLVCFDSVILPYLTADRFICIILIVKQSQWHWRPLFFWGRRLKKGDQARGYSDLEMTWLHCPQIAPVLKPLLVWYRQRHVTCVNHRWQWLRFVHFYKTALVSRDNKTTRRHLHDCLQCKDCCKNTNALTY